MQEYTFKTSHKSTRPVIVVYGGLTAVIDTGADIPLCSSAEVLLNEFGAKELKLPGKQIETHGIGGKVKGRIFVVSEFQLGPLIYPNLKFFVPDRTTMRDTFLLSASMFEGMILEIDLKNHYFKVTLPDDEQGVRLVSFNKDGEHICWEVRKPS